MIKRGKAPLAIGLLVIALSALLLAPMLQTPVPPAAPFVPPSLPEPAAVAAAVAPLPLPAADLPIREQRAQLQALSAAGRVDAACRLALALSHCRALAMRIVVSQGLEELLRQASLNVRGVDEEQRLIDAIAAAQQHDADAADYCAGVSPLDDSDAVADFQQQALRGTVRHRVIAALLQPDGSLPRLPREAVSPLAMDAWVGRGASQLYADHALRFLAEGYAARDPLALEGLILIHAPDLLHLEASTDVLIRLPDPHRFAGYALLFERLFGSEQLGSQTVSLLQRVLDGLSAAQRAALDREVEHEWRRWQAGPLVPLDPATEQGPCEG